jgi:hypothetical protein
MDEALRGALRPEPAPEALRAKLMAQAGQKARPWSPLRTMLLAAAALLVVGLGVLAFPRRIQEVPGGAALATAVSEASREFADTRDCCFKDAACSGKACGDWAEGRVGFQAPLPAKLAEADLVAGGTCRLAGQSVAHYTLRDGRMIYVFGEELDGCRGRRAVLQHGALQAEAWNEHGRGYLLLARK